MAALVDQVKGKRQQLAPSAESLDLRAMAAAQYANTDHDTDYGRLIQGQVDHTLFPGRRVRTTAAELETMAADFRENFGGVTLADRYPRRPGEYLHGLVWQQHLLDDARRPGPGWRPAYSAPRCGAGRGASRVRRRPFVRPRA